MFYTTNGFYSSYKEIIVSVQPQILNWARFIVLKTIVATVSMESTVERLMAAVSEKEKEVNALRRDLSAAKREIASLKETSAQQSKPCTK